MGKLETPTWILEGYDSPAEWKKAMQKNKSSASSKQSGNSSTKGLNKNKTSSVKEKTFKVKTCPNCKSDNVQVIVEKETKGMWECRKCKWKGKDIIEKELNEDELMAYMDSKGEEVA